MTSVFTKRGAETIIAGMERAAERHDKSVVVKFDGEDMRVPKDWTRVDEEGFYVCPLCDSLLHVGFDVSDGMYVHCDECDNSFEVEDD